jgi:hypothetical protein
MSNYKWHLESINNTSQNSDLEKVENFKAEKGEGLQLTFSSHLD